MKRIFTLIFATVSFQICEAQITWGSSVQSPVLWQSGYSMSYANLNTKFNIQSSDNNASNFALMTNNANLGGGFGLFNGNNVVSPVVWMYNGGSNAFTVTSADYNTASPSNLGDYMHPLFQVRGSGSVGVGTTSPDGFQVNASLSQETTKGVNNVRIGSISGTPRIIFDNAGSTPFELDNSSGRFRVFIPGVELFTINSNGKVGIGTPTPDAMLSVSGQVHAQEVKVSVAVPGPDYVFEKSYSLPTLEQVKSYIEANKHLPEVPSAKEMEQDGIKLSEMNMLLLKKVEELTLYVIELKKENVELTQRMNNLDKKSRDIK